MMDIVFMACQRKCIYRRFEIKHFSAYKTDSVDMAELRVSNTDEKTETMTGPDARGAFKDLFKIIAEKLSADEAYVTHQNIW